MSETPTFQDLLAEFSDQVFVGRSEQLALFEKALTAPRPPFLILAVSGQGGVGKTTLLEQYRHLASHQNVLTALVNEDQTSIPLVLAHLANQFGETGHRFKSFEERYQKYRELKDQVDADPHAPKGLFDLAIRSVARVGVRAVRRIPLAGDVADVFIKPEAEDTFADQAGAFAGYIAQRFNNKEDRLLLLETDQELTGYFLEDLIKIAQEHRVMLMFDTYEKTSSFLESWLIDLVQGRFGKFSSNVLFVVAGRYPLGQSWTRFRRANQQIELHEFTEVEAREYLRRFGIIDEIQIAQMLKLSDRLPVLLALLVSAPADIPADVSGSAVERFLQGAGPEQREAALVASVPRFFNQDILSIVLGTDSASIVFEWLRSAAFVRPVADGWAYHEVVRSLMLRYFRLRSRQRCAELHGKMAQYYKAQVESLNVPENEQPENEIWRKCEAERLYHRLSQNPASGLGEALSGFLNNSKRSGAEALRASVHTLVAQVSDEMNEAALKTWAERLGQLIPLPTFANRDIPAEELRRYVLSATFLCDFEALQSQQRSQAYFIRGSIHLVARDHLAALADYSKAIDLQPEDDYNYHIRGYTHLEMKDYPAALANFSKAIDLKPDSYNYSVRGDTYREMKDYSAALADYNKAIELVPQEAWNWLERGITRKVMKEYSAALADLSKGIDLEPKNAYGYAFRGQTYLELNDASNAQVDFAQVEALLGERGGPAYLVACGYAVLSQVTEACIWLRRAFERDRELVREARTDEDFDSIRETAEFKALIAEFESK